ncbi:MAG: ATP-grasp domain-containing protein [Anaerolineales bacterium]|nr:ATP-grasp domain-containing protein [Anaerolineales bacterium]
MNLLLTGGRAPATLSLARAFQRGGHTVFMAESLRGHLSQASNAIQLNFVVPPPRQAEAAFLVAIKQIVAEHQIDLIIPTCEEIFHLAKARNELPIFCEPLDSLNQLHNKWEFVSAAVAQGLYAPETMLIQNRDDILHAFAQWRNLIFKPVYSRFASRTLILPALQTALATLTFASRQRWVAQEFIEGQAYSSYSVCHSGKVAAHTAYPIRFQAGQGAAIAFEHVSHDAIFAWVRKFVRAKNLTGQIAFDFIETSQGQLYALECNPRATSGVHLLASHPQFPEAFINPKLECIHPEEHSSGQLSSAMLLYGLPQAFRNKELQRWLQIFLHSSDVILDFKDPLPFLLQLRSFFALWKIARREQISLLEAPTFDLEWNGEG